MSNYISNNGLAIAIYEERDALLSDVGRIALFERYLTDEERQGLNEEQFDQFTGTYQTCFARAACAFADDAAHAQRLYNYASKQWFMFATPVLSNGGTDRGLPISCYLNYVGDSVDGLVENQSESAYLSRYGGGIGTYFGNVRSIGERTSRGNKTTGVIPFIKVIDSTMLAFQQGANRRGSAAVYLDISHPEIEEFIDIRKATGEEKRRSRYLHNAVNVTDEFMEAMMADKMFNLVDPKSKVIKKTVKARDLWKQILMTRIMTGEPYLHFIDTSNKALPPSLALKGLKINTSNLCSEIMLPTAEDRTAVCCLSSVNIEKYDEWKDDTLFIEDLIRMLDNVLQDFIDRAPKELWRAINSATKERSLGLGAMGFHSYLQKKMIGFESPMALSINRQIFGKMYHEAKAASGVLAKERGEPEDMLGTGYRNAHVIAIAPNASSSYICGNTSPGIEPFINNHFNAETMSGYRAIRNKNLEEVLKKYNKNTDEVWTYIALNKGSVQGLPFLNEQEKEVFKTAMELNQLWLVEHASVRQPFIDQGQSLNLFFEPDANPNTIHKVHVMAWKKGLKSLYYLRSRTNKQANPIGVTKELKDAEPKVEISNMETQTSTCLACEG
jgi:ribonucleoside-diphosphate reductase alpha chain